MSAPNDHPPETPSKPPSPSPPTSLPSLVDFLLTNTTTTTTSPSPSSPLSPPLCPICLTTPSTPLQITLPTCTHTFDTDCLSRYFLSGYNSCPLCRTTWFTIPDDVTVGTRHVDSDNDDGEDFMTLLVGYDENDNLVLLQAGDDATTWSTDGDVTDENDSGDDPEVLRGDGGVRIHTEGEAQADQGSTNLNPQNWIARLRPRNRDNNQSNNTTTVSRPRDDRSRSPRRSEEDLRSRVQSDRNQTSQARGDEARPYYRLVNTRQIHRASEIAASEGQEMSDRVEGNVGVVEERRDGRESEGERSNDVWMDDEEMSDWFNWGERENGR